MITKNQIIEIADVIKEIAKNSEGDILEIGDIAEAFADYLQRSNPNFKRECFIAYVNGECGPNGGKA